jgi:hypothetical protein
VQQRLVAMMNVAKARAERRHRRAVGACLNLGLVSGQRDYHHVRIRTEPR